MAGCGHESASKTYRRHCKLPKLQEENKNENQEARRNKTAVGLWNVNLFVTLLLAYTTALVTRSHHTQFTKNRQSSPWYAIILEKAATVRMNATNEIASPRRGNGVGNGPVRVLLLSTQNDISAVSSHSSDIYLDEHGNNRRAEKSNPFDFSKSSAPLADRADEALLLQSAYARILEDDAPGEVIVVRGAPGAGKTRLVESSLRDYMAKENLDGLFASGKFERVQQNGQPYSAIVSCFTDLVDLSLQDAHVAQIRAAATEALGSEPVVLQRLISNLKFLVATDDHAYLYDDTEDCVLDGQAIGQFSLLCKTFIRAVASHEHPVILFFDDVQWADENSRALLESLVTDGEWKNVLIIAAFREESAFVGQTDTRSNGDSRKSFEEICEMPLSTIKVNFLSLHGINALLSDLFSMEGDETLPLSEVLMKKTYGNPYQIIQLLSMIQSSGWLQRSVTRGPCWEWDIEAIQSCTVAAETVMSSVSYHFERLDDPVRKCLHVASFLGYTFDFDLLLYIMQSDGTLTDEKNAVADICFGKMTKDKLSMLLDTAVNESLLEKSAATYRFSHDAVHEYLYKPTQDSIEAEKLHLRIGRHLWAGLKETPADHTMLLMTVEHMNKASHSLLADNDERVALSELNLRAGKAAALRSAYYTDYYRKAMSLLDSEEQWSRHYDLSLDLFNTASEHAFRSGRLDCCVALVREVIDNARNVQDKLRAYDAWMHVLGIKGKLKEANRVASQVLRALNEPFPRNATSVRAIHEVLRVFKLVKVLSDEELYNLPMMEDEDKKAAAKIMWTLTSYAFFYQAKWLLTCLSFRLAYLSLRHGISSTTPYSFAMLACSAAQLQNYEKAARFGRVASRVMHRTSIASQPSTLLFLHCMVNHWYRPLEESIVALTAAYEVGARYGDHIFSLLSGGSSIVVSFYCGRPLFELEEDMHMLIVKMKEMKLEPLISVSSPFHDVFQSLTAISPDPFMMLDSANIYETNPGSSAMQNRMHANTLAFAQLILCVFMENWERCPRLFVELRKYERETAAILSTWIGTFFSGIAVFQLIRTTPKRKFHTLGRKVMKKMSLWVESGVRNCEPLLVFLKAEQKWATSDASIFEIQSAYNLAIDACANHPYPHYEALANERAAEALLANGHEENASRYASRAYRLYSQWEAEAKVRQLADKYAPYITR